LQAFSFRKELKKVEREE